MDEHPLTLFLFRHGETEWAVSGRHTGVTDIPLTDKGRQQAALLRPITEKLSFSQVLISPRLRAKDTAKLAGLGDVATVTDDLAEVNYGQYEGLTTKQIREQVPGWTVWTHSCPGGESLADAATRTARVISKARSSGGNVAIFSHGHILRVLTATWLEMAPSEGKHFMLDTSTVSVLSHEHEIPAIKIWNAPVELLPTLVVLTS